LTKEQPKQSRSEIGTIAAASIRANCLELSEYVCSQV
jgi:hypothetical protein